MGYAADFYEDDLDQAEETAKSEPIHRMPNTWQVDKTIADARSMARAYQDRTGCDEAGRLAFECGLLGAHLRELAHFAASVESDLLKELQLALNETCNQYHTDGHADRVLRVYGLVGEEA
jgi:hypothetical protein